MPAHVARFGPFELDLEAGHLRGEGGRIPLRPKTWAVLCLLVENAGRLMSKNELLDRLWDGEAVSDTVVGISVAELRRALDDDPRRPKYIETTYGRGFCFIGVVDTNSKAPAPASHPAYAPMRGIEDAAPRSEPSRGLVGRAAELARLRAFVAATAGQARVMLLAGEAGIGKTALLLACLAELQEDGAVVGRGQCLPHFGQGYAFLPLMGALEDLCRRSPNARLLLHRHAPSWFARLDPETVRGAQPEEDGRRASRELEPAELVAFVQASGRIVLAFEDLHWADHATLDFIVVLAEHPGLSQCRVLGTYRSVEAIATKHPIIPARREMERHGRAVELALTGLDQTGVADYLAARFSASSCPPSLAIDLLMRSSGNPLFLGVSVDHLAAAGAFDHTADGQLRTTERYSTLSSEIPESLRDLVRQRFADQTERDQVLLATASVVGLEAEAASIAAALNEPVTSVDAACNILARDSIFLRRSGESLWPNGSASGRYAFRHPLYQRVLYDELAPSIRSQAHRRIARTLIDAYGVRAGEVAAVIAVHYDCSHAAGEAIDYHLLAARSASERHASRDALAHLHRALDLQKESADREREAIILNQLAKTLPAVEGLTGADFAASFARARSLNAGSADVLEGVITLAGLAVATLVRNNAAAAESLAFELIGLASTREDPATRIPAGLVMGAVLYHLGDISAALEYLDLDFASTQDGLSFGPIDLHTACSALRTPILWQAGRPDEALARAGEAVARAGSGAHPLNLVFALQAETVAQHLCGHSQRALASARRLRAVAAEQGIHEVKAIADLTEAALLAEAGDEAAVMALVDSGTDACRAHGAVLTEAYVLGIGAEGLIKVGQLSRAAAMLEEAEAAIAAGAARFWEPELYRLRGEIALRTADRSSAEEHFADGQRIADQQGSKSLTLRCALGRGRLRREAGREHEAREIVEAALRAIDGGADTADGAAARVFLGT